MNLKLLIDKKIEEISNRVNQLRKVHIKLLIKLNKN